MVLVLVLSGAQWSSVGTPVTQLPHMPVVPSPAQVPGHICLLIPLIVTMMLRGHCSTAPPAQGVTVLQWHMLLIDHTQHKSISSEG